MRVVRVLVVLCVVSIWSTFGLLGCGGDGGAAGGSTAISTQPLAGMINGMPWTFAAGDTIASLSDATSLFATLYDQALEPACSGFGPQGSMRNLTMSIPTTVGHYTLSLQMNETFYYQNGDISQNDVATSGELDVTEVTATTLSGGVKMAYRAKDAVNGQFQISICAP